ncbi:ammonium transporter [Rhodovulum sp. DZ06]|uniref:ammonium transporter n=1 Tax=Rhodovulum sp. DZ06 TaxID=3425126 RepID=UPI003D3584E9
MNGADTAWIIVATALVLFMTLPGLALFYGGLVRSRNVLSVLMQCIAIACLMSVLWLIGGYSIAFGPAEGGWWGGLDKMFLAGVDADTVSGTIPEVLFFAFQMTFAIITPALIVGAYVERISFAFVMTFSALWMLICYAPVAHWIWGGGWLSELGTMDFAGGIVVHETAGLAAVVLALMLGERRDHKPPHNPGYVMIGASMLWVGWFGFNAGSQLAADGGAAMALTVTHISAAAASLSWAALEKIRYGKASMVGLVTGTIAGLASITPASGWATPVQALIIGGAAGVICQYAVTLMKEVLKVDDTLDVFAVHGVGGIFGTIMIAVFGHGAFGPQFIALGAVGVWTLVTTFLIAKGVSFIFPMRVSEEDEIEGLDYTAHGERAYDIVG